MSQLRVDELRTSNGSETDEIDIPGLDQRFAKAWVNFNGTGTVAIRDSYNVSGVTDNGVGDYTVNFTNGLGSSNYSALVSAISAQQRITSISSDSVGVSTRDSSGSGNDSPTVTVAVFSK